MQNVTNAYNVASLSLRRTVKAKAEYYENGDLLHTFQGDKIVDLEIQRAGEESKFFGFGISQKLTIKLLDKERELNISKTNSYFQVELGLDVGTQIEYKGFPPFFVKEVTRDETNNQLTIVAYDLLDDIKNCLVEKVDIQAPYTLGDFTRDVTYCATGTATYIDEPRNLLPKFQSDFVYNYTENGSTFTVTINPETNDIVLNGDFINGKGSGLITYELELFIPFEEDFILRHSATKGTINKFIFKKNLTRGETIEYITHPWPEYDFIVDAEVSIQDTSGNVYNANGFNADIQIASNRSFTKGMNIILSFPGYFNEQIRFTNCAISSSVKEDREDIDGVTCLLPNAYLNYEEGANFSGKETLKEVLDDIAEITQSIYYINQYNDLIFKPINNSNLTVDKTITKAIYSDLKSEDIHTLQAIASITELGDNLTASTEETGETQYIRANDFMTSRDDLTTILDEALARTAGISAHAFELEWRGDPALEPGDRIAIITKDDNIIYSYLFTDTLTFNGGLREKTEWRFKPGETVTSNPTSLGEAVKQTIARVDKVNQEISFLVSENDGTKEALAAIQMNSEGINASITKVEEVSNAAIDNIGEELTTLTNRVNTAVTSDSIQFEIRSELGSGIDKVVTATGFVFDNQGLTISKEGSEMETNIDENGMSIFRDNVEVLTADNTGVYAYNLHARTYLIVGETSRFEDFTSVDGEKRTGCFWIGG